MIKLTTHKVHFIRRVAALVFLLTFWIAAQARAAGGAIGHIVGLSGPGAKIIIAGTDYETEAAVEKEIKSGDTIVTPQGVTMSVLMNDGSTFKINENSRLSITGTPNPGVDGLDLEDGELLAELGDISGEMKTTTPSGVVAVRGTEFNIRASASETTLTLVQGQANFSNQHGSVDLGPNQQSKATPTSAPTPPVVVDPRFFIEWAANIESIGTSIEAPLVNPNRYVLEDMHKKLSTVATAPDASADDLVTFAGVLFDMGNTEDAIHYFKKALDIEPGHAEAVFGIGMAKIKNGQSEEASAFFNEHLEKAGENAPALFLLGAGLSLLKLNKLDDALASLEKSVAADPKLALAHVGVAVVALKRADRDKARAALQRALEESPNMYQATTRLAEIELSVNNFDEALELSRRAAEAQPFSPEAQATLAKVLFFKNEYAEAKRTAQRAVELNPFHSGAQNILAMIAVFEGQIRQAQQAALKAIALDQHNAPAHDVLARVYMLKRNRDGAIVHWERALEAEPNYVPARLHYAELMNAIHKAEKAEEILARALDIEPENDALISEMGRALELQHRFDEAGQYYVKAVELNPRRAKSHARLASFYMDRFKLQDALVAANNAVRVEPGNPVGYLALGLIHDELDNTESATINFKQALQLDPENAEARYRLGIILGEDRDRFFEALSEMRRAQLVEPTVITREELRDNRRVSGVVGSENYQDATLAATGYGFNRNLIFKLRFSDREENHHRIPGFHSYDEKLQHLSAGGNMEPESLDQGATLLLNYRPDYYNSYILSMDTGYTESGVPMKTALAGTFDKTQYTVFKYHRVDLNYRRIMGPKSALTVHFAKTNVNNFQQDFTVGQAEHTDTGSKYSEYEAMYETKFCKYCKLKIGMLTWSTSIMQEDVTDKTLDYSSWSRAATTQQRQRFTEEIYYANAEFEPRPRLRVQVRGEKTKQQTSGFRDTGEIAITYRLSPGAGVYWREGQSWHINAAESVRPSDAWTWLPRYESGSAGMRSLYREAGLDVRLTPSTFLRAVYYEQKRKTYTSTSGYTTPASRVDEDGVNISVEQQIGGLGNVNVSYTDRFLNDVYNNAPVPNEPLYMTNAGMHIFANRYLHFKYNYLCTSSYYQDATISYPTGGYDKSDLIVYYEPDISYRLFLHIDNMFKNAVPDSYSDTPQSIRKIRFGLDRWF